MQNVQANDAQVIAVYDCVSAYIQSITKSGRNYITDNEAANIRICMIAINKLKNAIINNNNEIALQQLINFMHSWDDELYSILHDVWESMYKSDVKTHLHSLQYTVVQW